MQNTTLTNKEKFESINIVEQLNNIDQITYKAEKKYIKFLISIGLLGVASLLTTLLLNQPTVFIIMAVLLFSMTFLQNKVINYFRKKEGSIYFENQLIEQLKNIQNQKIIVDYFDSVVETYYTQLASDNKKLIEAFANEDYKAVYRIIHIMIKKIVPLEKQALSIKKFKDKMSNESVIENKSEIELELNGNFKKYL